MRAKLKTTFERYGNRVVGHVEDAEMYEDVQTRYTYAHSNLRKPLDVRLRKMWRSSRDSARTPVQWSGEANAGFTTAETPWFYVNPNYTTINVAQQENDPQSILNFYRKAIALRKSLPVVRHGSYQAYFRGDRKRYVYSREMDGQKLLVICSFSAEPVKLRVPKGYDLSKGKLILSNYENNGSFLQPYETRVYLWEE